MSKADVQFVMLIATFGCGDEDEDHPRAKPGINPQPPLDTAATHQPPPQPIPISIVLSVRFPDVSKCDEAHLCACV